jgi:hypothetical protein
MKYKIVLFVLLLVFMSGLIYAQDEPKKDPNRKIPSAEEMSKRDMDSLKVVLNLTDDQIPFIQKVLDDSYSKMQKVFQSDPPDFMQMRQIMEARDNDILTVLTEEQAAKYKDYREKQRAKFRQGNRDN